MCAGERGPEHFISFEEAINNLISCHEKVAVRLHPKDRKYLVSPVLERAIAEKKVILSFEEDLVIAVKNASFVVSHPSSALVESSAIGAPTFVLKESLNGYFEGIEKCSLSDLCGLGGVNDNNKKSMDGEDINLVENIDAFIRLCSSGSANCSKMSRHE